MLLAFILFRQHHQAAVVNQHPGLANPEISKIIGDAWRVASSDIKAHWKRLAEVSSSSPLNQVILTKIRRRNFVIKSSTQTTDTNLAEQGETLLHLPHQQIQSPKGVLSVEARVCRYRSTYQGLGRHQLHRPRPEASLRIRHLRD